VIKNSKSENTQKLISSSSRDMSASIGKISMPALAG
jgi:hypothetical protein